MRRAMKGLVILSVFALAGCGHPNSLLTANKDQALEFLYQAENHVAQEPSIALQQYAYVMCVTNPHHFDNPFDHTAPNPCNDYLKAMAAYAKHSKNFSDVTLSDLKDPAVAKRLGDQLVDLESINGDMSQFHDLEKALHPQT